MGNRLTEGRLYGRMEDFALKNTSFRNNRINSIQLTAQEAIEFDEFALSKTKGKKKDTGSLILTHGFRAVRRYDEAAGCNYFVFSGGTTSELYGAIPELHVARAVFPDSDNPVEDLGKVTLEQEVTYELIAPEDGNLDVSHTFTIYDDDGDIVHQVSSDPEHSRHPSYIRFTSSSGTDAPAVRQVIADTTREVMEADGTLSISPEEWLNIIALTESDLVDSIEETKERADLRMTAFSFNSLTRVIRAQAR